MILIGEHAVVYGAKAVAMPVYGMSISLKASRSNKDSITINEEDLSAKLLNLLKDAKRLLNSSLKLHVSADSSLPLGAGLGSSAALSVGLIKSIASLEQLEVSNNEVSRLANTLEERFHGSPSGLDVSVVAHNKPIIFQKDLGASQISPSEKFTQNYTFALIDSQKRASTKDMVKIASKYFSSTESGEKLVRDFNQATAEMIDGLEKGPANLVKSAMDKACKLLESISVVPDDLKKMINEAICLGCIAVKPTGAGGGGYLLALLPKENSSQDIIFSKLINRFGKSNVFGVSL